MGRKGYERSYYLEDGTYFDVTTGRSYYPDEVCEICKKSWLPVEVHHYLPQQKCMRDLNSIAIGKVVHPKMWTQEFINENQKLYTVCRGCHKKIHNCTSKKTVENGHRIYDYLWREEKTEVVTKPKAFVVKKNV